MSIPTKVLVLAIDAGDPELILEWSRDGSLPNLRGLLVATAAKRSHPDDLAWLATQDGVGRP